MFCSFQRDTHKKPPICRAPICERALIHPCGFHGEFAGEGRSAPGVGLLEPLLQGLPGRVSRGTFQFLSFQGSFLETQRKRQALEKNDDGEAWGLNPWRVASSLRKQQFGGPDGLSGSDSINSYQVTSALGCPMSPKSPFDSSYLGLCAKIANQFRHFTKRMSETSSSPRAHVQETKPHQGYAALRQLGREPERD